MMPENILEKRTAKIHRQMHVPIAKNQEITVHVKKSLLTDIEPRSKRTIGAANKRGVGTNRQVTNLGMVDEIMNARKKTDAEQPPRLTAKEIKEKEIQKALSVASKKKLGVENEKNKRKKGASFSFYRIVLATFCTAAAIFAIVYLINLNYTDISLQVTALQTGIEASYPSYMPQDYSLSSVTSEKGKIIMKFNSSSNDDNYMLTEEPSSWDSTALLNNYIKNEFEDNYSMLREQGLTIYVDNNSAAWVNGGILYKIEVASGSLTKKQIQMIATSL